MCICMISKWYQTWIKKPCSVLSFHERVSACLMRYLSLFVTLSASSAIFWPAQYCVHKMFRSAFKSYMKRHKCVDEANSCIAQLCYFWRWWWKYLTVQLGGGEGLAVEAIEPVDHSQLTLEIVGCIWCRLECILPKKNSCCSSCFCCYQSFILEDRHFAQYEKGIHLLIPKGDSGSLFL